MAQTVQLKRSALSGKVPDTGSLALGEIAINTYDGKLYFKKSGSAESVETILTTNSTTTGSITVLGTGSFGLVQGSIQATNGVVSGSSQVISILSSLNQTTQSLNQTTQSLNSYTASNDTTNTTQNSRLTSLESFTSSYATTGSNTFKSDQIISGSVGITSNLTVLGAVNASQFNINVISSSIIYQSGSTKFGDTADDIMSVTGSIQVSGSVTASAFVGDGSGLTNLVVDLSTAQLNSVDGNSIPARSFAELYVACAVSDIVDLDFGV